MNERIVMFLLALLALLALFFAPWASITRETGARGTVIVLPNQTYDFTGRTEPVKVPREGLLLALCTAGLIAVGLGSRLGDNRRNSLWLLAGLLLMGSSLWGVMNVKGATTGAQHEALYKSAQEELQDPGRRVDVAALQEVVDNAQALTSTELFAKLGEAGMRIRSMPYAATSPGLAAGFTFFLGLLAFVLGLRRFPSLRPGLLRASLAVLAPFSSILLAVLATAVVIFVLQPTPLGSGVHIEGWRMYLAGRLDVLWYSYQNLFASSLTDLSGFLEALKFATPLIFTGLSVAFGFRAGLFNIGAPGQMVLGGIFAMFAGLYLPGPRFVVVPLAVFAAALGGALWGGLPGYLKARFGASEVINTILLNYIAASLLLFVLSPRQVFAAPVARMFVVLGVFAVLMLLLGAIARFRRSMKKRPRVFSSAALLLLLLALVGAGLPRTGDKPINLGLPFKAPGSELKSHDFGPQAHLPQLPEMLGVPKGAIGEAEVALNIGLLCAPFIFFAALWLLGRLRPRVGSAAVLLKLFGAAMVTVLTYVGFGALGLNARATLIPPSNLNLAFVLALLGALAMYVILWRTSWGYALRAVGLAPAAAAYGGVNIARSITYSMAISGAFAGLAAAHYVLGGALEEFALRQSLPTSDGFDGIAVALLGQNSPLGVVLSALLFGILKNGGSMLNITYSDLTRDVVNMILALVVLFIAAKGFLPASITDPLKRVGLLREVEAEAKAADAAPVVVADAGEKEK